MGKKFYLTAVILIPAAILTFADRDFGQRPPMGGPPPWIGAVDTNKNGRIEREEHRGAADLFFKTRDANESGTLESSELPPPLPRENRPPLPPAREVPPFLFLERGEGNLTREQFLEKANQRFTAIDLNADGAIDAEEIKNVRPPREKQPPRNMATAEFIGAEMRFGDKQVKNAPFSAETLREESKRLYDGTLIKNRSAGAIYRDGEGRVRQEQPFERIGGFPVLGSENEPVRLIHIIDFAAQNAFSINTGLKTAMKIPYLQKMPVEPKDEPRNAKKESLGKQIIEGVTAEGTRTTHEIPAGEIGNDKPIFVVSERWFSSELQTVVLSKHTDPFIGEVVFRLVNIRLGEPSPALFKIPEDYILLDPSKNQRVEGTFRKGKKPE